MKIFETALESCGRRQPALARHASVLMLIAVCAWPAGAVNKSWNVNSGGWATGGNWSPAGEPGPLDDVFLGNLGAIANGTVWVEHDETIAGLQITDGMALDIDGYLLNVQGDTTISGSNTVPFGDGVVVYDSRIRVDDAPGWAFITDNLTLSDGARLNIYDGADMLVYEVLNLASTGDLVEFVGDGKISMLGAGTTVINNGEIRPGSGFGLFFDQTLDGNYDLDGVTGNGALDLGAVGAKLRLEGAGLADAFGGNITLASESDLYMQFAEPWVVDLPGHIDVTGVSGATAPAVIRGAELQFWGELAVSGTSGYLEVRSPAVIHPTAEVLVHLGDRLRFNPLGGDTVIEGGTFELLNDARIDFDGPTTVSGGVFDIATDAIVEFNDDTTLEGGVFETVSDSFADGYVSFDGSTEWRGTLTFTGAARQVGAATVTAPTTINAERFDLDGGPATQWNINASTVLNAELLGSSFADGFGGVLNIGGGLSRLTVNLTGDLQTAWSIDGTINLNGSPLLFGTRLGGAPMLLWGAMNVSNARIEITSDVITMPASVVTFAAPTSELRMRGETSLREGTQFNGQGALINGVGGEMALYHTGSLGSVGLVNQGLLRSRRYGAADQCAVSSVDRFTNSAQGAWRVRVGGYVPGDEHDLLIVSGGAATLGGTLEIELFDAGGVPFSPQVGDEFTILTALAGVNGTFLSSPQSCAAGATYQWTVLYGANDVRVRLDAISPNRPGDMNCDCHNDFLDIDLFVEALNYPGGAGWPYACPWLNADCTGDGLVDFFDIDPFVDLLGT